MSDLLLYYQRPEPATWVFLSTFLFVGIYFVFHRFFSIRNLDLLLLILLAPGLMMVYEGRQMKLDFQNAELEDAADALEDAGPESLRPGEAAAPRGGGALIAFQVDGGDLAAGETDLPTADTAIVPDTSAIDLARRFEYYGFLSLLIACGLLMIRVLLDPALVRRPLLIPNLSIGGLSFIGASLFVFLMSNIITSSPREQQIRGPSLGPGYALMNMFPDLPTLPKDSPHANRDDASAGQAAQAVWLPNVARILAILSNLAIVMGIIGVGYWHFDNVKTGIGCAVMYLLLPYTAQLTGNLQHVMPGALLVLALLAYRQPLLSGLLLGAAAGLVYYPLFLLPLWISFYWHRGLSRFLGGISTSLVFLACLLLLQGVDAFALHLRDMFGLWSPRMEALDGIWGEGGIPAAFRLPVLVGFILLSVSFVFWPPRKNLGALMCCSAGVMLAAQFWHGNGGGLYMAWFLPFTLLTIFRPNLDDRVATSVVRLRRSKSRAKRVETAG